ncbi:hypothetical protein B566_EDAN013677 [Ephemera danica]|nr:hypothetical protein B566_EDAN013677 [Ephemera danica]
MLGLFLARKMSSSRQQRLQQLSKRTLKDHNTQTKDIKDEVIAGVYYDIVKEKRNEYTADVWKLLRQVYLSGKGRNTAAIVR